MNPIIFQTKINESKISTRSTLRRAFTLVELLTVVVIISMLAGMSMLALNSAMTSSKEAKTRGTIAKLDAAILDIYESYQERFDNITISDVALENAGINMTTNPIDPINPTAPAGSTLTESEREKRRVKIRALAKLHFIHDIMRMEMPFQWEEVIHNAEATPNSVTVLLDDGTTKTISATDGGRIFIVSGGTPYHILSANPPVLQYYRHAYTNIKGTSTADQSSVLLFLIIANLNPEALENFHGSEIGDIDGDGLREFHDAWGNPIRFVRFAPAFTDSDLQPNVVVTPNFSYPLGDTTNWDNPLEQDDDHWKTTTPSLVNNMASANTSYSDPFDPNDVIKRTWFMYPLIISGGADGIVDLCPDINLPVSATINNIYNPVRTALGLPRDMDGNGVLNHYDNIHNHRSGNSF
jgi:prepilin-type N-terminal cleavage/methylation domain-containing protein